MKTFTLCVFLITMITCFLAWRFAKKTVKEKGKRTMVYLCHLGISLAAAFCVRFLQYKAPTEVFGTAVLKFCASLPTVLLAWEGYRIEKNRFDKLILTAIVLGMFADIAINISTPLGAFFFGIGHIFYMHAFFKEKRPSKRQTLLSVSLCIFTAAILYFVSSRLSSIFLYLLACIYLSILICTTVFASNMKRNVFIASLVFALSDLLLIINILIPTGFFAKLFALWVNYLSLILYGISIWENEYPELN